jgi:hypothetical protein
VTGGTGAVRAAGSVDGEAIVQADTLYPGGSVTGTVTVSNDGDEAGAATLAPADVRDAPGPRGAPLSPRLVVEVTDSAAGTVYRGPLVAMPSVALGTYTPGDRRIYGFQLTLPGATPAADDALQGSATAARFQWTLSGFDQAPAPAEPVPTAPAGDAPAEHIVPVRTKPLEVTLGRDPRSWRPLAGRLGLTATCDRPCRLVVDAQLLAGHAWRLPRVIRRIDAAGGAVTVRVPAGVRRAAFRAARAHTLALKVRVTATAANGATRTVTARISVRR